MKTAPDSEPVSQTASLVPGGLPGGGRPARAAGIHRGPCGPGKLLQQAPCPMAQAVPPHASSTGQQPRPRSTASQAEPSAAPMHEDWPSAAAEPGDNQLYMGAWSKPHESQQRRNRAWGQWEAGGGMPGWEDPPTHVRPQPWGRRDTALSSPASLRLGGPSHITWGPGHQRAAWRPAERLGGQVGTLRTWGGLAFISSCGWSS